MRNKKPFTDFEKEFKNEIFTFTKRDDKNILSFHTGELTVASLMKVYVYAKKFFNNKSKEK